MIVVILNVITDVQMLLEVEVRAVNNRLRNNNSPKTKWI